MSEQTVFWLIVLLMPVVGACIQLPVVRYMMKKKASPFLAAVVVYVLSILIVFLGGSAYNWYYGYGFGIS